MMNNLHDLVREILTDYNDNFIGEPCEEIVEETAEEVMKQLDGVTDEEIVYHTIDRVVSMLFD